MSRLVAAAIPPGPAFLQALSEVWRAGDAIAPLDPNAPAAERRQLMARLRPTGFVSDGGVRRLVGGEPVDSGIAVVLATSGAGGQSKLVEISFDALEASARASVARIGASAGERWLCCLPPHHIAGLQGFVRAKLLGSEPEVMPKFDPGAVASAEATLTALVPTMLVRLLDSGVDLERFNTILLGGAAPPPGLINRARAAGARIVETYGMTETAGGCVYDGVPLDGVKVRVDRGGRIHLRGPTLASGYRDDPTRPLTDAYGWLITQDLGEWGEGNRLRVRGRADRIVISGGENVDPDLVAHHLSAHPAVNDVAIIGRPDPEWGQRLVALVVPANPARPPTLLALQSHVTSQLSPHHAPRDLLIVERLPRTPLGKLRYDQLPEFA